MNTINKFFREVVAAPLAIPLITGDHLPLYKNSRRITCCLWLGVGGGRPPIPASAPPFIKHKQKELS